MPFVRRTAEFAKTSGHADGVSALGDVASFFHLQKKDDLLHYEMTLPTKCECTNLKEFCLYHKQDFDKVLSEKEREMLLKHHGKTLHLSLSPVVSWAPKVAVTKNILKREKLLASESSHIFYNISCQLNSVTLQLLFWSYLPTYITTNHRNEPIMEMLLATQVIAIRMKRAVNPIGI